MIQLKPDDIHIWSTDLTLTPEQAAQKITLLSPDERERALRFRQPLHQTHFIAARAALRHILSLYLQVDPASIVFGYADHKKPFLQSPRPLPLEFNLAHSDNMAVYALTLNHAIGIDIEKIQEKHHLDIAERFFSPEENAALQGLPQEDQCIAFYQLWARKEALVKATGKGLLLPLSSFSVSPSHIAESVVVDNKTWFIQSLAIEPGYASALACIYPIKKTIMWILNDQTYQEVK